jgi:uncharacterized protein (TIGR01777 family)
MKIIISGGTGLIGGALTESLVKDKHEVIILSRSAQVAGLPAGARAVVWDARTAAGWGELADGADAIVNLAGASIKGEGFLPSRWTKARKLLIRQSRLDAGRAVVEAIRNAKQKPKILLQASAVGYYGPRGDEIITESDPAGSDFLARVCVDWEASTAEVEAMGVRRALLRSGLPLTLGGGAFPLLVLPFRFFAGNWFGNGRQFYPWIHIDDYVAALRYLIESPAASGAYNISAPNPVSNRDFGRTLAKVMKRPLLMPVPRFALEAAMGEVATVVFDGQRAVPAHLEKDGFKFGYPQLEDALRDLLHR